MFLVQPQKTCDSSSYMLHIRDRSSTTWFQNMSLCNCEESTMDRTMDTRSHRSKWWRQKLLQQLCWCSENTHLLIHLNVAAAAAECCCLLILTHHLRQTASAAQHRQSLLFSLTVSCRHVLDTVTKPNPWNISSWPIAAERRLANTGFIHL